MRYVLIIVALLSLFSVAEVWDKPCTFDPEVGQVAGCIHPGFDGSLFVNRKYIKKLHFRRGLAPIYSEGSWMYVSKDSGLVVISGVPSFDNGPDVFHNGLVRVVKDGKYGYADRKGKLVIAAQYDGALNFESGVAKVCRRCKLERDSEGHGSFVGGEWLVIDKKGRERREQS